MSKLSTEERQVVRDLIEVYVRQSSRMLSVQEVRRGVTSMYGGKLGWASVKIMLLEAVIRGRLSIQGNGPSWLFYPKIDGDQVPPYRP